MKDIKVSAQYGCDLPPRSLITVWARLPKEKLITGMVYSFHKSRDFIASNPNVCIVEMLHNVDTSDYTLVPVTLINLGRENKNIKKGDELGYLNVSLETWGNDSPNTEEVNEVEQNTFIVSPADVPRHRKTILGDKSLSNGPFTPNLIGWPSDGHRIAIGWAFYRMGSVPNFSNGQKLFFKDYINVYIFEYFYAHFILFLLCCVIYFSLLTWHF